ncbi:MULTISPECIES: 50S ribosomal protein L4 [Aeromicrobium]|uniref:50S ribosomal protein L4, sunset domain variant n=1 Tax=Aeromicrobium TaxID=2040 RepID=UPI0006F9A955|nr:MULTISPECIES: 50S ribosomal protein L4 [Aeromicrobium]KQX74797.1 50S ribosomal protein L4 [Aeromicrobium sp. Root472D3]MBD8607248.1 50S ribosomal protein L4 [Aeromicrobium sp. CFBP 8757]MCL8251908.1 50S ribosomal protein L4 [Aeromicrobium fastidiosum]
MVNTIDAQLPVDIFDVQTNIPLIHQVVVAQLAAARQGTHSTKSRGEVSGGGKKPYRQKGTGRARQGSIRAPQYNGGGIVHGPTPRDYSQRTNKKMKAAALRGALSDRARTGRLHVVESIVGGDKPSTKLALATLLELTPRPRVLIVVDRDDTVTALSLRNHDHANILTFDQLNTYDVLKADDLIFTQAAFDAFVAARSTEGVETVSLSAHATEVSKNDKAPGAPKKAAAKKTPAKKAAAATVVETPAAEADEAPAAEAKPAKATGTATQPYGPGSKAPLKSGNAPKGHEIKGNEDSMKYHEPDTQWYDSTVAEVWFDSAETAEAAGFTKAGDA